jgi:hypothetical protein
MPQDDSIVAIIKMIPSEIFEEDFMRLSQCWIAQQWLAGLV